MQLYGWAIAKNGGYLFGCARENVVIYFLTNTKKAISKGSTFEIAFSFFNHQHTFEKYLFTTLLLLWVAFQPSRTK
jgi:hypothetical protein